MSKKAKKSEKKKVVFPEEIYIQRNRDEFNDGGPVYFTAETTLDHANDGRIAIYKLHKTGKLKRKLEVEEGD